MKIYTFKGNQELSVMAQNKPQAIKLAQRDVLSINNKTPYTAETIKLVQFN